MENLLRDNKDKRYAFLDFEGCNLCLNECHNLPWQAGLIMYKDNKIEEELDLLIKWPQGIKVSRMAAIITGYDPNEIEARGKPPEEVLDILIDRFEKADIIAGYNLIGYDAYMLQAFCRALGRKPYNIIPKLLDMFPIAKAVKLEIPFNKNDDFIAWQYRVFHRIEKGVRTRPEILAKEFNIQFEATKLHDALYDLQLLVKIWDKLKYMIHLGE